ncbi:MAG: hypothetical protein LBF38_11340, partial [Deltaproteobacteria bacterium]|nr:hypothetical protein [Deltaproteobacteria bacterium]
MAGQGSLWPSFAPLVGALIPGLASLLLAFLGALIPIGRAKSHLALVGILSLWPGKVPSGLPSRP